MRSILASLLLLASYAVAAQTNLQKVRTKSYQVMVFTTTATSAEKYIATDSIPLAQFENSTPAYIFPADSVNTDNLPVGHYVLVSIVGTEIVANLVGVSNMLVYPVNNRYNIQLDIRTKEGAFIPDAKVWANGREAHYNQEAKTYWLSQRKLEEAFVRIYAPGDTLLMTLELDDDPPSPIWKQRWNIFKTTHVGKAITWVPSKISSLLRKRYRYKPQQKLGDGYVLFNQPKYKLTDTVKLKAYLVNRHLKRYRQKLQVWLEYYAKGKSHQQKLTDLQPVSPGSYVYAFPLSDTLVSDIRYNIVFKNEKGKRIINKSFNTEDYLLDEIGSYAFRSAQKTYYPGDTMVFYASAKDANGLSLLDGSTQLILSTNTIGRFYKDTMYVKDTLYIENKPLATGDETLFKVPVSKLPAADLTINATLIFKNSNNELHEERTTINYALTAQELTVSIDADTIAAVYRVSGKSTKAKGQVTIEGDLLDKTLAVEFPAKLKIDPLAGKYTFTLIADNDTLVAEKEIENYYKLSLDRISNGDTLGFVLNNPNKVPVSYMVLQNQRVVASGKGDEALVKWQTVVANKRHLFVVKWQYMWAGKQREGSENIGLLYKLLKIDTKHSSTVFPGQKDSITVSVMDYKNRPAEGVNLAAVSYNSQFKKDIDVREPPYLARYKNKNAIARGTYEIDEAYNMKRYQLGDYQKWLSKFGVDTMQYYTLLFPTTTPFDIVSPVSEFIPQVSVHVVQKGRPQEVYLLYINRQLVYYNGVTDKMKFAYPAMQGFTQIAFRLYDKYVQLDSIYVQPFYKHDIVIDLDKLPATAFVKNMPPHWDPAERNLIENSTWQLDNQYRTSFGCVWQDTRVVKLNGYQDHLVGPFVKGQALQFFAPNDFDISFPFEPGYEYNLSKQITRLEKQSIFDKNKAEVPLPKVLKPVWVFGDTLVLPPSIVYAPVVQNRFININYSWYYTKAVGKGKLQFIVSADSSIALRYVILVSDTGTNNSIVLPGDSRSFKGIEPGKYSLLLVNKNFSTAAINSIVIHANETFCINTSAYSFDTTNSIVEELVKQSMTPTQSRVAEPAIQKQPTYNKVEPGRCGITGVVTDAKGGHAIPGASVFIKGTLTSVATALDGSYNIGNIKEGKYTIVISSIGYNSYEHEIRLSYGETKMVNARLTVSTLNLQEVVVTGYGTQQKRSLTASVAKLSAKELSYSDSTLFNLVGRVAGVYVQSAMNDDRIMIRGIGSASGDNKPVYVIDGILYDELPGHIKPGMIASMDVLKGAAATALYGSRAASGAIVITTGAKTVRSIFRDYALWEPELITNKDGTATFEVTYPDNITGWDMYVLGMDKHLRIGKGRSFTRAFKPVVAQLSTPQFLIEGDSVQFIGKALNHTSDSYAITTTFSMFGKVMNTQRSHLPAQASVTSSLPAFINNTDTLKAAFHLTTTTGFKDGEERKIPVFKQGAEETVGAFYILQTDTTTIFTPKRNGEPVSFYAQNNTLDVLLDELQHLKEYPYYCMEQTASKLKGLLMERKIMRALNKEFKDEKAIKSLLKKLQDSQLFDGGWSWWEKGKPDLYISAYVIEALLPFKNDPLVETTIRNGLLYLQNQLPQLKKDQLLVVLNTLSTAGHIIDYQPYIAKLNFDSLSQHQQWAYVQLLQKQQLDHSLQLKQLVAKATPTMLGGLHWGVENYRWYSNEVATTVLAFQVIEKEKAYSDLLPKISQYFLEQKRNGYYRNSVEAASIVSTILPYILQTNEQFNQPATVRISGDTSFTVSSFPFKSKLNCSNGAININKSGGGLTYVTLYQQWWNNRPELINDKFQITTQFLQNAHPVSSITAGEKVKMLVSVQVLADAEYVLVEMPIPAGCNYSTKSQSWGNMHKEYFKNKVVLFAEKLNKGEYQFEVDLEARYQGSFTLNPAKVQLMYFPTFYGLDEMKKIKVIGKPGTE
jgi:alpha-2-macroglobulin